ncbi:MAG: hypothetical protein IPJ19_15275 [Planctomycetes bacterium]|nr:hypothetical protein [Planctomycetota bacterium]
MSVSTVTAQAAMRGVRIEVRHGRVFCRPKSGLTPELRDTINAVKTDLLRLLPDVGVSPPANTKRPILDPAYWDSVVCPNAPLTPIVEERPCRCCSGARWWRRAGSSTEWFCIRCHPPSCAEIEVRDA